MAAVRLISIALDFSPLVFTHSLIKKCYTEDLEAFVGLLFIVYCEFSLSIKTYARI